MSNIAICTHCGLKIEVKTHPKLISCPMCHHEIVLSHALHLATFDIPHATLMPILRLNLHEAVLKNDLNAIYQSALDLQGIIPGDLEADYFFSYADTLKNDTDRINTFLTTAIEGTAQSIDHVGLHLIYHAPVNTFDRLKAFIENHCPDHRELFNRIHDLRQKKDDPFSKPPKHLYLFGAFENSIDLKEVSLILENKAIPTWFTFRDLRPLSIDNYPNHMRRIISNSFAFFLWLSPQTIALDETKAQLNLARELKKPLIVYTPDPVDLGELKLPLEQAFVITELNDAFYEFVAAKRIEQSDEAKTAASIFDIELFDDPVSTPPPAAPAPKKKAPAKAAPKPSAPSPSKPSKQPKPKPIRNSRTKPIIIMSLVVFFLISSLVIGYFSQNTTSPSETLTADEIEIVPLRSISVNYNDVRMRMSEQLQIQARSIPAAADINYFNWESSNPNVATVDANGLIVALNPGVAEIKVNSGPIVNTIQVFVQDPLPTLVRIDTVEPLTVVFGTSDEAVIDRLPKTIQVFDSRGNAHLVALNWQLFEFNANNPSLAPAVYTVSSLFEMPPNVELDQIPAQIVTQVYVGPALVAIETLSSVLVPLGESPALIVRRLPATVSITDSIGKSYDVEISWTFPSNFNAALAGRTFTVEGNFTLPEGIGTNAALPPRVIIPVTINETNLEITEYEWQLVNPFDYLIAGIDEPIRLRISGDQVGLVGAGRVVLSFGLANAYLEPGVEDVYITVGGTRFLNYGQIEINLARSGQIDLDFIFEVQGVQKNVELFFDLNLEMDPLTYVFDVVNPPVTMPKAEGESINVSFNAGSYTIPSPILSDFVKMSGSTEVVGQIESISYSLMRNEILLAVNSVQPSLSPGGTILSLPTELPSNSFNPFDSDWLVANTQIIPNRLQVRYKLVGMNEKVLDYDIDLTSFVYLEVHEFDQDGLKTSPPHPNDSVRLFVVGVVMSIENNLIYLQDRSATNPHTVVLNIGGDVSNVTKGSHIIVEINLEASDEATLIHNYEALQLSLLTTVLANSITQIKDQFSNQPTTRRFTLPAGLNVTYTDREVMIHSENPTGPSIRFPLTLLENVFDDPMVNDSVKFFQALHANVFPSFLVTVKEIDAEGTIQVIDVEISPQTVSTQLVAQAIARVADQQAKEFFANLDNLIENAPITSITQTSIKLNQEGAFANLSVELPLKTIDFTRLGLDDLALEIEWTVANNPANHLDFVFKEITLPLHGQADRSVRLEARLIMTGQTSILIGTYDYIIPSLSTRLRTTSIEHINELIEEKISAQGIIIQDNVLSRNQLNNFEISIPIPQESFNITLNQNLKYTIRLLNSTSGVLYFNDQQLHLQFPNIQGPPEGSSALNNLIIASIGLGHDAAVTSPGISGVTNIVAQAYSLSYYHSGVLELAKEALANFYLESDIPFDGKNNFITLSGIKNTLDLFSRFNPPNHDNSKGFYEWRWSYPSSLDATIDSSLNQMIFSRLLQENRDYIIYADLYYVVVDEDSVAYRLTTTQTRVAVRIHFPSILSQFEKDHAALIEQMWPKNEIRLNSENFEGHSLDESLLPRNISFMDNENQAQSYTVTWASNNRSIFSDTGIVTTPGINNVTIFMTAVIDGPGLENVPNSSKTVNFYFTVVSRYNLLNDWFSSELNQGLLTPVAVDTEILRLPQTQMYGFNRFAYSLSNNQSFKIIEEDNEQILIQNANALGNALLNIFMRGSNEQTFNFTTGLNISIPQNPTVQIVNIDVVNKLQDVTVNLNKTLDYLNPESLTYSYILNQETITDRQFLPQYGVILDSNEGLHGLNINWKLSETQPTTAAIGGITYLYQGQFDTFVEAPWIFTSSSVLQNTPQLNFYRQFYVFTMRVTVKDLTLEEAQTELIDRWVIVESDQNRTQVISQIVNEARQLKISLKENSLTKLVDLSDLDDSLVTLNIPASVFLSSAENALPRIGFHTVEWVISANALYETHGVRHPQLRFPITLQVIQSKPSNND